MKELINASFATVKTKLGIIISVRFCHPLNALDWISFILGGIILHLIPELANECSPIISRFEWKSKHTSTNLQQLKKTIRWYFF